MPPPDCLLALDSAGAACSAALWRAGRVEAARFEVMGRGQSERLVPMIEEVMAAAGRGYEQLDALAVTRGPGGFTGVRIGLATARGLALALGRPVIGLTSFEAVAAGVDAEARQGRPLAVLLDGKRREAYLQVFDAGLAPLGPPACVAPEDLVAALPAGPLLLAGDGAASDEDLAARNDVTRLKAVRHAEAARFAGLAAARGLPAPGAAAPTPLYLRPADVTPPRRHGAGLSTP